MFANDLNPDSIHYLKLNLRKNKTKGVRVFEMDARDFIVKLRSSSGERGEFEGKVDVHVDRGQDHVLMNYPMMGIEFLGRNFSFSSNRRLKMHAHLAMECRCIYTA